jgi:hypothetical protein
MPNNDTQSDRMGSTQVRMARDSRERGNPGSITYVVGTVAYRAALTAESKIEKKSIFAFPASAPVSEFQDMIVHDDYVIVELPNADQFQVFIRPKPEGLTNAISSRSLTISTSSENSMAFRADYDLSIDTRLYLYVIHNQLGV